MNSFKKQYVHIQNICGFFIEEIQKVEQGASVEETNAAKLRAYDRKHEGDENYQRGFDIFRIALNNHMNKRPKSFSYRNLRKISDALNQPISADKRMVH